MDTREDIPRISIENAQDWQRLESGYKKAVLQRFEENINNSGLANERDLLQAHILQFIDQTLTSTQPNLRINGRPYGHMDDNQCEPFDEALDRRIWSLADTRMQWLKRIAETRRKLPEEVARELAGKTEEHQEFENHTSSDARIMREPVTTDSWLYKETFIQKLTSLVNELDQTLPEQCHRTERVKAVATDIKAYRL
ncbi:hypothetical protein AX14_010913 [Amanita brunnescens Koide BX004]|nr:hypothetical protein AX14_010913 [Amanita brunnescens Koide BX004]